MFEEIKYEIAKMAIGIACFSVYTIVMEFLVYQRVRSLPEKQKDYYFLILAYLSIPVIWILKYKTNII